MYNVMLKYSIETSSKSILIMKIRVIIINHVIIFDGLKKRIIISERLIGGVSIFLFLWAVVVK